MIKFEIENESENKKVESIVELKLKLYKTDDGEIEVIAISNSNMSQYLFILRPDGTFKRCKSVDSNMGFQLNDFGQIIEQEYN